ncbi:MAG: right-handed parallel beta-helix repeat-containing protein [Armatimonadetes bacterium]|nr:right-handed parallel beta-helix repeat-containing protein [Armatimonadota bacterium]
MLSLVIAMLSHQSLPEIELRPGLMITRSCRIKTADKLITNADESGQAGAIRISGDNITVDFQGSVLRGSEKAVEPDERKGTALSITGDNVTIKNATIRGYKIGVAAWKSKNLQIIDSDFSYNWKQRLKSDLKKEDVSDWMSFHNNENNEWLRFGAGIYLQNCDDATIRNVTINGGQCGLMMTNCKRATVEHNDFSFNSAIGVGMYRTTDSKIQFNKIDFCVRGFSYGVYNRGQDSAGILMYEQSSRNKIYCNSVTHGGDGLFLWAGQFTMDTGQGGCNDNEIISNDFSHAPTNGIEVTFSRNYMINNLMMECWHGIWGGYSFESVIDNNQFKHNAESIAIEHGQNNRIMGNTFDGENMGINLWANAEQDPNWGYVKHRDTRSHNILIGGNLFKNIEREALRIRKTTGVDIRGNTFTMIGESLAFEESGFAYPPAGNFIQSDDEQPQFIGNGNTVEAQPKKDGNSSMLDGAGRTRFANILDDQKYKAQWQVRPEVKDKAIKAEEVFWPADKLRGRRYILVDEWGPHDFKSPKLWPREYLQPKTKGAKVYEILGPKGSWKLSRATDGVTLSESHGTVPGFVEITFPAGQVTDWEVVLEYVGEETTDYRGMITPAGKPVQFKSGGFDVPIEWNVRFWNYDPETQDPRTQFEAFDKVRQGNRTATITSRDLNYGWSASPAPGVNNDYFATVAEGEFTIQPGEYIFDLTSDDGVRLYLDGKLIHDDWTYHAPKSERIPVKLGGKHKVKIEHFELNGYSSLKFALVKGGR